jgi:transposase
MGGGIVVMLIPEGIKIYLYLPATDMRKSIDTLSILVADTLSMNVTEGHLYLFRNRSGNKLKALYYEANCFTLWYRRLEKGKFIFPRDKQGHIEMTSAHLQWLLASDKYSRLDVLDVHYENYY